MKGTTGVRPNTEHAVPVFDLVKLEEQFREVSTIIA